MIYILTSRCDSFAYFHSYLLLLALHSVLAFFNARLFFFVYDPGKPTHSGCGLLLFYVAMKLNVKL